MELSYEFLKSRLPEKVSLNYVAQGDDLDNRTAELQRAVQSKDLSELSELCFEWFWEQEADNAHGEIDKLCEELQAEFPEQFDEIAEAVEEYRDDLRDILYERNDSDVLKDLLRHTSQQVFFYDTGYEVAPDSWAWSPAELRLERIKIKQLLGIKDSNCDKSLDIMLRQASYGGQLVIYFLDDVENWLGNEPDKPALEFKNYMVAIIDVCNGSGDHTDIPNTTVLPFKREHLHLDKTIKYSYTYSVCGMYDSWCSCTCVRQVDADVGPAPEHKTTLDVDLERDARFAAVFKAGKCSFGDMDIRRHRHVSYSNNYPCGSRCADCGTFWID